MIFTPKGTKILLLHLNAEKNTKAVIAQSVFWEVNKGYKQKRVPLTNKFGNY